MNVALVDDIKADSVCDESIRLMLHEGPILVEDYHLSVAKDLEKESPAFELSSSTLALPRDRGVESEHVVGFGQARRYGRTFPVTILVEGLRGELVFRADVEQI